MEINQVALRGFYETHKEAYYSRRSSGDKKLWDEQYKWDILPALNQKLSGFTSVTKDNITDDDGLTGVVVDDEGNVIVPQDTPAGTYEVEYEICEVINPANCDSSTMEIVVLQSVVVARDDRFAPVSEVTGGTAGNLLENDTINDIVTGGERVNLTIDGMLPEGITVDLATGDVQVAPGTPAGSYEIRYQVCHVANPTMCDTATAMITVTAAPVTEEDDATEEVGGGSIGAPNSGFAAQAGSWILAALVGISLLAMMAFGARRRYLRSVQVRK